MTVRTLAVELRDARTSLREWWAAIVDSTDNPIVRLGLRRSAQSAAERISHSIGWGGLFFMLLWASRLAFDRWFMQLGPQYAWPIAVGLALLSCTVAWMALGLFESAMFAVRLISTPGTLARGQFEIDEGLHASRLSDREFVVGLSLLVLPRLLARWAFGPVVALGGIVLWHLASRADESGGGALLEQVLAQHFKLQSFLSLLPLAVGLLALTGLLASIALVMWLMTLGHGVKADWQLHLLAGSFTFVQLAWIPLAIWRMTAPPSLLVNSRIQIAHDPIGPLLAFIAVPAFLAGSLHFARHRPIFRLIAAALLPPLGLALWCIAPHVSENAGIQVLTPASAYLEEQLRYFGALALVNPLALSYPGLLGLDWYGAYVFGMFGWQRLPLLLLMQMIAIAICAHGARLAIHDWRTAEE